MKQYIVTIDAFKDEEKRSSYGWSDTERVYISRQELFEALTKYIQVKGYGCTQVSVIPDEKPVETVEVSESEL